MGCLNVFEFDRPLHASKSMSVAGHGIENNHPQFAGRIHWDFDVIVSTWYQFLWTVPNGNQLMVIQYGIQLMMIRSLKWYRIATWLAIIRKYLLVSDMINKLGFSTSVNDSAIKWYYTQIDNKDDYTCRNVLIIVISNHSKWLTIIHSKLTKS